MKMDHCEIDAVTTPHAPGRFDIYAGIHKALRTLMADTLMALGRADPDDVAEVSAVSGRVLELMDVCTAHVVHENHFIHTAIEARATGASAALAHEHEEHLAQIARLKTAVSALCQHAGHPESAAAAHGLYRELALFVAYNYQHMHVEETAHNCVLWARYTDAELIDLHHRLVASIPPAEMMHTLRWLLPSLNPAERTALLQDMRAQAPAPAFQAVLDLVQPHLSGQEWRKLTHSLNLAPVPGLVAG